jgi:SAM-dependent methyltransferase
MYGANEHLERRRDVGRRPVNAPAQAWREALDAWALPEEIVNSAAQSPWIHPPVLFDVPRDIAPSPSHERAREVLSEGSTVLDVGCGGGIAAFAVTPPAHHVIGVDHQPEMLDMFRAHATARALTCETVEGFWPGIAPRTPDADVVTAHHVVYNVADIEPFLQELDRHARLRVVLEMPDQHPLASMTEAWRHFWNLERPHGPTPDDLLDVITDLGLVAHREQWNGPMRVEQDLDQAAHFMRIRLCLPASREDEVLEFLRGHPPPDVRQLSTLWWDVESRDA